MTAAINMPALLCVIGQICEHPERFGASPALNEKVKQQIGGNTNRGTDAAGSAESEAGEAISKIRSLQGKIQEVEVQAAIRQVQVKILEIKIRQVELMVLVRQAQQVMELRGREASLLAKKRHLESRIVELDAKIREMDGQLQIDPAFALSLLQELQALLSQTETALANVDVDEEAEEGPLPTEGGACASEPAESDATSDEAMESTHGMNGS